MLDSINYKVLTENLAQEICTWRYTGELSIYNFSDWEEVVKNGWDLSIKDKRESEYVAFMIDNELIGYGRVSQSNDRVYLGIGLRPDLCGKGFGTDTMKILIRIGRDRFPQESIYVEVREFNTRALRCYEKIDFKIIDRYWKKTLIGGDNFILMRLGG